MFKKTPHELSERKRRQFVRFASKSELGLDTTSPADKLAHDCCHFAVQDEKGASLINDLILEAVNWQKLNFIFEFQKPEEKKINTQWFKTKNFSLNNTEKVNNVLPMNMPRGSRVAIVVGKLIREKEVAFAIKQVRANGHMPHCIIPIFEERHKNTHDFLHREDVSFIPCLTRSIIKRINKKYNILKQSA